MAFIWLIAQGVPGSKTRYAHKIPKIKENSSWGIVAQAYNLSTQRLREY